jgi:hypothetical protein
MGYAVDENATRFSNYFHVLRELVHLAAGQLALEPRFEVKALLADHLYDDARATTKVRRRLGELRTPEPDAPSQELAALLDKAHDAYLDTAYGELKPTLIAALRIHLKELDPIVDEPSLRVLTQLLHRQERHTAELPIEGARSAFDDLGALPLRPHVPRALRVLPPVTEPARDAFIEIAGESGHAMHDLMDAELCAAELTARTSHEHPEMPWEFHVDMARQTWDEMRHAEVIDRLLTTELGCHWGDYPVGLEFFRSGYPLDLAGRLALFEAEPPAAGDSQVLEYLAADKVAHAENARRWSAYLRDRAGAAA